jgi:hypothetical protein
MDDDYPLPLQRSRLNEKPDSDGPGIYFIFLKAEKDLIPFSVGPERLAYIGKSESTIEARNHATYENSSYSTLRRSLGAILRAANYLPDGSVCRRNSRERLSGKALRKAIQNYRFCDASERALRLWMIENLTYGYQIVRAAKEGIEELEKRYIKHWNPVLNLVYCRHPQKGKLEDLRRECREAARRNDGEND